jgi:hypothetical protein
MAFERKLEAVSLQPFTANGTTLGQITLADPALFKTRQIVLLVSNTQSVVQLQVKRVDETVLFVGPNDNDLTTRTDISAFLVADVAAISASEQTRPFIVDDQTYPNDDYEHEEEPTDAKRVVLVDKAGRKIDSEISGGKVVLATSATISAGSLTVDADTTDRPGRKLGQVFIRKPDDSVNLGDAANPVSVADASAEASLVSILAALAPLATEATLSAVAAAILAALAPLLTQANFDARVNTLGQKPMAGSTPVVIANDQTSVPTSITSISDVLSKKIINADRSIFGEVVVAQITEDIEVVFVDDIPPEIVAIVGVNGGTVTLDTGAKAVVNGGAAADGLATMQTHDVVIYRAGHETRADFTAAFLDGGVVGANQHIGIFTANPLGNGFYVGFDDTTFVIGHRNNGVDVTVPFGTWSGDPFDGSPGSHWTRAGAPEAIDFTQRNLYRVRYGWLGVAPCWIEIISPDGEWITAHEFKFPNAITEASLHDPSLPIRAEVIKTGVTGANVRISTSSWRGASLGGARTSRISEANSTTVPLGANATFQGAYANGVEYSSLMLICAADQPGSLHVEHSTDGVFVDTDEFFQIEANKPFILANSPRAKFVRVRYVNGSTPQGLFHLQMALRLGSFSANATDLDAPLGDSAIAQAVRAVVAGKRPTFGPQAQSTYTNQQLTGLSPTMLWRDTTPNVLDPGHVFDSSFELTEGYGSVLILAIGLPNVPGETFQEMWFELSDDGVNPVLLNGNPLRFTFSPGALLIGTIPQAGKYWRLHWKGAAGGFAGTYGDVLKTNAPLNGLVELLSMPMDGNSLGQIVIATPRVLDPVSQKYLDVTTTNPLVTEAQERQLILEADYDINNHPIYVGDALPGTTTSDANWRIKQITWVGNNATSILWADGNTKFDNVWDNRTLLTYS